MADNITIVIEDDSQEIVQIPVGPPGPQGPTGATGPQGPQGPAGTGGGAEVLNDLTDVTITTPASGHIIGYNGSQFVNQTIADLGSDIEGGFF